MHKMYMQIMFNNLLSIEKIVFLLWKHSVQKKFTDSEPKKFKQKYFNIITTSSSVECLIYLSDKTLSR